jgi:hypothetical protein
MSDRVTSNGTMNHECRRENNLEGRDNVLIELLIRILPRKTEENQQNSEVRIASILGEIGKQNLSKLV